MMRSPSSSMPGSDRARAPVAMMTCLAASVRWRQELRRSGDVIDLVLAEQEPDALADLVGDAAAARDDRGEVGLDAADLDPELARVAEVVEHLGGAEQRLRRDAAPVEADPAEPLALDARGLEPELRAADRRDVAAGTRADNDDVVLWIVLAHGRHSASDSGFSTSSASTCSQRAPSAPSITR
jgi:hypothetical protein